MQIKNRAHRTTSIVVAISLVTALVWGNIAVAAAYPFDDVAGDHPYRESIGTLHELDIIRGFPDGTFGPEKRLTRAEFSAILTKAKNIDTGGTKNKKCFKDVRPQDWFTIFACTLKAQDILEGYPDATFRAGNNLKRAEIVQLLCQTEKWIVSHPKKKPFEDSPLSAYFIDCLTYAKENGFLEKLVLHSESLFEPGADVTRGEAAQLVYNTIIAPTKVIETDDAVSTDETKNTEDLLNANDETASSEQDTDDENLEEETNIVKEEPEPTFEPFTPHPYKEIDRDTFANVRLDGNFSNTFYRNEVYYFEGSVLNGSFSEAFIFFIDQTSDPETKTFTGKLDSQKRFSIPVVFRTPGNFELGIIPGKSGSSIIAEISVLEKLPSATVTNTLSTAADTLKENFKDGETVFSWNQTEGNISKLIIKQGTASVTYFSRQNRKSFSLPYEDLKNFKEGEILWFVETSQSASPLNINLSTAWKRSHEKKVKALTHSYRTIEDKKIEITSLPEVAHPNKKIQFKARTLAAAGGEAYITFPDGTVKKVPLLGDSKEDIPLNTAIDFSYTLPEAGIYIFEVNEPTGGAIVNVPIYADEGVPIIPDYFDLNDPALDPKSSLTLLAKRDELLAFINQARKKHGLSTVVLDDPLSEIAQLHSEDMANRNFFAHENPDGKSPEDRRKAKNFPTSVQENLAKSATIQYAHEGLMRSPIHRVNILEKRWTRVGLGIARDSAGYLLVSEEFSTNPLTDGDLQNITEDIRSGANAIRGANGLSNLAMNDALQNVCQSWSNLTVDENFFGFTSPNGKNLLQDVRNAGINGTLQAFVLEGTSVDALKEDLKSHDTLANAAFTEMGVGVAVTADGTLRITIVYLQ
ncbi:MAG: hypothetical protein UY05_C0012G0005 [Candidatus Peregrinibacteria bacterium GW2011_GWA2_47_7]|nr:MAG: hypothetical protein UY05_C0012G0005 [Candidatus Peregrinibacteria bacterium GW2011_GWA2_47_7]